MYGTRPDTDQGYKYLGKPCVAPMTTVAGRAPGASPARPDAHPELALGRAFAQCLARKDFSAIEDLFHPNVTVRALTPGKARYLWEAHAPHSVVTDILQQWFEETDRIESLLRVDLERVGERNRVSYLLSYSNPDGKFLVEQQAFYSVADAKISWMSIVCSGPQPI